jgi:hypothetical protein
LGGDGRAPETPGNSVIKARLRYQVYIDGPMHVATQSRSQVKPIMQALLCSAEMFKLELAC